MAAKKWIGTTDTDFGTAGNFSPSGVPADGDTLTVDQDATKAIAASDQSAILLASLVIKSTNAFTIGDSATPLQIGATSWRIGDPSGSATAGSYSGRINLDFGTDAFTGVVVAGSTQPGSDAGKENVRLKGVNSGNKLYVQGGRVGVATDNIADVATLGTIAVIGGTCNIGSGVTLTTLQQEGGVANLNCAATTVQHDGGTLNTAGSGAIGTLNVSSLANLAATGTITTLSVDDGGHANFLAGYESRTVTTIKLYKGATLSFDPTILTVTNPIQLIGCSLEDVTINIPNGRTIAVA